MSENAAQRKRTPKGDVVCSITRETMSDHVYKALGHDSAQTLRRVSVGSEHEKWWMRKQRKAKRGGKGGRGGRGGS
eukprot:1207231-Alexandrium_andersonii.AAC.1